MNKEREAFPAVHTAGGELDVESESKMLDSLAMSGQDIAFAEEMQSLSPEEQEAVTLQRAIDADVLENGISLQGMDEAERILAGSAGRPEAEVDAALDGVLSIDSDSDDGQGSPDFRGYAEALDR